MNNLEREAQKKLDEIQNLLRQRDEINARLNELLKTQTKTALPASFSLKDEVLEVIKDTPNGIKRTDILAKLNTKYPDYGIDKRQVASSLSYLKNTKGMIDNSGHGVYVLKKQVLDQAETLENDQEYEVLQ